MDAVRQEHRFLWDEDPPPPPDVAQQQQWGGEEDPRRAAMSWEKRLAKKYYERLFREYALADMSRYREGAVGMRWRTESEVFRGKGQFTCGNKACDAESELTSFEVHFGYEEHGERRQALVKLRVCPRCERKLHYRQHKAERRQRRRERRRERREEQEGRHERGRKRKRKRDKDAMRRSSSESRSSSSDVDSAAAATGRAGGDAQRGERHAAPSLGADRRGDCDPQGHAPLRGEERGQTPCGVDGGAAAAGPGATDLQRFDAHFKRLVDELLL